MCRQIFCDLFNLTNLVHSDTCFMKNSKSTIDLILTNKPLHFQKTHVVETGLSDYHKMISTFFKASSSKLRTRVIYYRSYKNLMNQISCAVWTKQILTFSKMTLIRTTTFWLISSSESSINMLLWKRNLWEVTTHLLWIENFKKKFMWEVD